LILAHAAKTAKTASIGGIGADRVLAVFFLQKTAKKTARADRMNDAGKPRPAAVCPLVTPAHGSPSDGFIYDGARWAVR